VADADTGFSDSSGTDYTDNYTEDGSQGYLHGTGCGRGYKNHGNNMCNSFIFFWHQYRSKTIKMKFRVCASYVAIKMSLWATARVDPNNPV